MYDMSFLDSCGADFWCMFVGLNNTLGGALSIALLSFVFFIVLIIRSVVEPDSIIDNLMVSSFASLVIGFLLFLGKALFWEILVIILLIIGVLILIKQIMK